MPDPLGFTFDRRTGRYRSTGGRFVSGEVVRNTLDVALDAAKRRLRSIGDRYAAGEIDLRAFAREMRQAVKEVHIYSATLAKGGFAQMSSADWGRVGQRIAFEYGHLEGFVRQIRANVVRLDGSFTLRVGWYAEAGRDTFSEIERLEMVARGKKEKRNVLDDSAEIAHCVGERSCTAETAKGWQPIGEGIPIGRRRCLRGCKCRWEFR